MKNMFWMHIIIFTVGVTVGVTVTRVQAKRLGK